MRFTRVTLLLTLLVLPFFLRGELPAQSASLITAEKGWAVSNRHLFWTSDDGDHWKDITPPTPIGELLGDVFFLDASRGWVLLSSDDPDRNLLTFDLARTTNSGQTWTTARVKVPSQKPDELDGVAWLSFVDENHGWMMLRVKSSSAFSWGLLMATEDGGVTWGERQAPIAGRPIFSSPLDGWISGSAGPGGIYSTHDGGKSWQGDGPSLADLPPSLPTRPSYGDVKLFDPKHGALPVWLRAANDAEEPRGTALVLYVTDDSGRTWKRDKTLIDRGAFSKTGGALSRIGEVELLGGPFPPALITAFNDRVHKSRVTIKTLVGTGEATSDAAPSISSDGVLRRQGDDIDALSFVTVAHGWARTSLGELFETEDGGKSWRSISPIRAAQER